MTLHSLAHQAVKMAKDNSPLILTALGVAGTVSTAVFASKASFKAAELIHEDILEKKEADPRTPYFRTYRENFDLVWKEFIPPVISLTGTIACIICANRIGTRRAAAMAAAYSLSERAITEYKDKVVEKFGEVKGRQVQDEIAQDRMETVGRQEIFATGAGTDLCYEKFTARYFWSSMENIKHAVNRVNHKINNNYEASLNDFYDYLGLDHNAIGEELGWNSDKLLEVTFSTTIADGNRPCIVFDYTAEPTRGYFRYA